MPTIPVGCLLGLLPRVLQHSISPGAWGKLPSPGDLQCVWHRPPQLQEGQTWHRLAPGPLQRQCPFERIFISFEWIFCASGEMLLCCLSQLSLRERLAKGSFPLPKDIVQAQVTELTVVTHSKPTSVSFSYCHWALSYPGKACCGFLYANIDKPILLMNC